MTRIRGALMFITRRIRRYFPRWGSLEYELFDSAAFLLVLGVIGYLVTEPPSQSQDALRYVYHAAPAPFWGVGLSITAVYAMFCSYRPTKVRRGMVTLQAVCIFWALCFGVGALLYAANAHFGAGFPWVWFDWRADASIVRVSISVVLYLWIASRLQRDLVRWDREQALLGGGIE